VTEDWKIKVCDFGLSRTSSLDNQNSLSKLRGTYVYAAPEVYFGDKYSSKSDIYSMAVVLWELLTRTIRGVYVHPFADHRTAISFEFQIVIEAAKGLRPTVPASCPQALADLLAWMWATDPKMRPNALQVLDKVEYLYRDLMEHPDIWMNAIEPHARPLDTSSSNSSSSLSISSPSSLNSFSSTPTTPDAHTTLPSQLPPLIQTNATTISPTPNISTTTKDTKNNKKKSKSKT
jgi:Protein tyrosine and serine/threonine kinase